MSKRKATPEMMQSGNGSAKPNGKVPKSERFELACAISTISNSQEKFIAAVDTLKGFSDDVLRELDLEIEAKKYEVDRLDDEFKRNLKDGQIQTDQAIAEYKYSAALDILKERQETPIAQAELQKLNSSLAELRAERATELDALRKEERERAHQQLAAAIKNSDLVHKAEIAEKSASVIQLEKEIVNLKATNENHVHQLNEQRKLTREVAEAAKSAPIHLNNGSGR